MRKGLRIFAGVLFILVLLMGLVHPNVFAQTIVHPSGEGDHGPGGPGGDGDCDNGIGCPPPPSTNQPTGTPSQGHDRSRRPGQICYPNALVDVAQNTSGTGTHVERVALDSNYQPTSTVNITPTLNGLVTNPDLSPDTCWVVFSYQKAGSTQLWKVPTSGGQPIQLTQDAYASDIANWSPLNVIVYEKNDYIMQMNTNGKLGHQLFAGTDPQVSPNGSIIAYKNADGLLVYHAMGKDHLTTVKLTSIINWLPDGTGLLVIDSGGLELMNLPSGDVANIGSFIDASPNPYDKGFEGLVVKMGTPPTLLFSSLLTQVTPGNMPDWKALKTPVKFDESKVDAYLATLP